MVRSLLVLLLVFACVPVLYAEDSLQKQSAADIAFVGHDPWKLGVFYYDPGDKRMFPPKKSGLGCTINFANPLAVFILLFSVMLLFVGGSYYRKLKAMKKKDPM